MSSDNTDFCAVCGNRDNLLRCSRCKLIFYCSKEHQKKHWRKHKLDCEGLSEKKDQSKTSPEAGKTPVTPTKNKRGAPSPITPPRTPISSSQLLLTPSRSPGTPSKSSIASSKSPGTPGRSSATPSRSSGTCSEKSSTSPDGAEFTPPRTPLPIEGSSEAEILATSIEKLCLSPTSLKFTTQDTFRSPPKHDMPITSDNVVIPRRPQFKDYPESNIQPPYLHKNPSDDMVSVVIEDLNAYGLCVLDNFCGPQLGKAVLQEVLNIYSRGVFQDGQLVAKSKNDAQSIRSDKILWVDGKEVFCKYIGQVLNRIDNLIMKANKSPNNGKLGHYNINGRTKAMLAVYPGSGTHYVKHVDNPNNDGRCITSIYYLNINWDVKKSGGLLRIFPENEETTVADIAPLFDRLLLFWSDRQNPHEVQPSYDTRYAITLWYFDATERALATKRFELEQQLKQLSTLRQASSPEQLRIMQQVHQGMQEQERLREQQNRLRQQREKGLLKKRQSPS